MTVRSQYRQYLDALPTTVQELIDEQVNGYMAKLKAMGHHICTSDEAENLAGAFVEYTLECNPGLRGALTPGSGQPGSEGLPYLREERPDTK